MSLLQELLRREKKECPIVVGWVGAGEFGAGMQACAHDVPGLYPAIIADLCVENAVASFVEAGRCENEIVVASTATEAAQAIAEGKAVATACKELVFGSAAVDVVVEATGIAEVAAQVIEGAIANKKHVVVVSIEADCTVGTVLKRKADEQGVVYTIVDGDQPGNVTELVSWARTLGLEVIAAGKGTHYWPHHMDRVRRKAMGRQNREFADGTKSAVELCCMCNCTGLTVDEGGPQWPAITLEDIPSFFRLRSKGGQLNSLGIVDAIDCVTEDLVGTTDSRLSNGTFIVVRIENKAKRAYLKGYFSAVSDDGQYGVIYRPHHLCGGDASMSVVKAALLGEATGAPLDKRMCEVITIAKRDLAVGEVLQGMGSGDIRGILVKHEEAMAGSCVPAAMAENVTLLVPVAEGTRITYDMLQPPAGSALWRLRAEQDAL